MGLERPIRSYESVRVWEAALREQWGGDPLAEDPEKLRALEAFCEFTGRDPDELVAFCFLRRRATGERFASVKRRRELAQWIREFLRDRPGSPLDRRRLRSQLLSFLIHNGVLIQLSGPA